MVKIYLDAGHGGYDNGATGNGLVEKTLNLVHIEKIKALLQANYKNVEIMTTRDTDIFLSLNERCDKANNWGADVFLSCHTNANTSATARGWSSHIYTTPSKEAIALQNVLHPEVFNQIKGDGVPDLGKFNSNFAVVRQTKMPAILTESLFVSNTADAN
jgi:N-acetylmuramoyl-L-alanine amidase